MLPALIADDALPAPQDENAVAILETIERGEMIIPDITEAIRNALNDRYINTFVSPLGLVEPEFDMLEA